MVKYLDNANSGFGAWRAAQNAKQKKSAFGGFMWWLIILMAVWWVVSAFLGGRATQDVKPAPVAAVDVSGVPATEIENDDVALTVQGLRISDIKLRKYQQTDDASQPVTLLGANDSFAEVGYIAAAGAAPTPTTHWQKSGDATFTWRNAGMEFRRTLTFDGYVITVSDAIKNNSNATATFAPYARIVRGPAENASAGVATGGVVRIGRGVDYMPWRRMDKKSFAYTANIGFVGFADQYWETIAASTAPDQTMRVRAAATGYTADASSAPISVAPGANADVTTHIYAGPREYGKLTAADKYIPGISRTMDYGWFWFLARPMQWLLNTLDGVVHNYGIAIIIMTILLRVALWPLTRKSYTSMVAMQRMQPEMARIQKQFANDKARQQMEMMKLYRTHKTSPMSGCLPLLIQIPIFFALYKALLVSVQMRGSHFLWIGDLATMDPYFILPILMGVTMWLQQYLQSAATRNAGHAQNDMTRATNRVMKWMPALFTIMFAWMPAGLVLYWTVSNLFGILQMYIIRKRG